MHDVIIVGVPVLTILMSILLNQRGLDKLEGRVDRMSSDLNGRMDRMNGELTGRIDRVQSDLSRFYQILGEHGGKIDLLSKK
jgi:hypothetical protein